MKPLLKLILMGLIFILAVIAWVILKEYNVSGLLVSFLTIGIPIGLIVVIWKGLFSKSHE